ncbi:MAG: efflux RND transporter periplasmic adaptor subunit [Chitinivibrionales bacterium]|nr:efflux RND transporter periplasmic adaptor subunit [Chitinivibrionales bacterium]
MKLNFAHLIAAATLLLAGCGKQTGESAGKAGSAGKGKHASLQHDDCSHLPDHSSHHHDHSKHAGEVCDAHHAPKNRCFICDASLRDPKRLWCKGHARYEDRCWLCHPELQDKSRLYCSKHGLYEDECFICHPKEAGGVSRQQTGTHAGSASHPAGIGDDDHGHGGHEHGSHAQTSAAEVSRLYCREHQLYEAECGSCHPDLIEKLSPGKGMKVRFMSKESAAKAGISCGSTQELGSAEGRSWPCRVTFDQERSAKIAALSDGIVRQVLVKQGKKVRAGQILARIHSADAGDACREYLIAHAQAELKKSIYERESGLFHEKVVSQQAHEEARAEFTFATQQCEASRQRLINLGFTVAEIDALVANPAEAATAVLNVRAPFSATILERKAVAGQSVEAASMLFSIADLSTMWIEVAVPAGYAGMLSEGDSIAARFRELPQTGLRARITWISPQIDAQTRTVTVRALARNTAGILRDGMFGEAAVLNSSRSGALGVPETALQRISGKDFVFVKNDEDLFEIRRVVTAGKSGSGLVGIRDGLSGDEQIVLAGSFIVRSELQKSKFGAGCADH